MIRWLMMRDGPSRILDGYLHPEEREEGKRFRHPGRHRQFQLGRAAAKNLLIQRGPEADLPALGPRGIWIHRTPAGWPQVLDGQGRPLPVSLSIAHTQDRALCAMCPAAEGSLGADMELVDERPRPFLEDFYTDDEREQLAPLPNEERARMATLFWTIKEAVLKARRTGLTENAKNVDVESVDERAGEGWSRTEVGLAEGHRPEVFFRWAEDGRLALAIARCATS